MKDRMNIVIVGHVDHGKSTLIGRLLADTNSLPQGKLEQVKNNCERNSKPFEYAFLLDALKDEQDQGITIDTARIFFKSEQREYIIIDAPGHIEFVKNMVSGAARAEAAILLIDAFEGIAENSKRHGYLLSMLGIKQIVVAVNKMDLIDYDQEIFENIKINYSRFLREIGVEPNLFIPVAARNGENLISHSDNTAWYKGQTILEAIDGFKKQKSAESKPFRMFIQDVYKFASQGNDKRIVAGTVNSGSISVGDEVYFYPSGKKSRIASIEEFNTPIKTTATAGNATGFTLTEELYIKPAEIMSKTKDKKPFTSERFKANIFWLGKKPFVKSKPYKLKIGTNKVPVELETVENVMDTSNLTNSEKKNFVDRYEVARCVLKTKKPISFDLIDEIEDTSRFVIVDEYDIAGGGIIIESIFEPETEAGNQKYSQFEVELNELIRKHFPHWDAKKISNNDFPKLKEKDFII